MTLAQAIELFLFANVSTRNKSGARTTAHILDAEDFFLKHSTFHEAENSSSRWDSNPRPRRLILGTLSYGNETLLTL